MARWFPFSIRPFVQAASLADGRGCRSRFRQVGQRRLQWLRRRLWADWGAWTTPAARHGKTTTHDGAGPKRKKERKHSRKSSQEAYTTVRLVSCSIRSFLCPCHLHRIHERCALEIGLDSCPGFASCHTHARTQVLHSVRDDCSVVPASIQGLSSSCKLLHAAAPKRCWSARVVAHKNEKNPETDHA